MVAAACAVGGCGGGGGGVACGYVCRFVAGAEAVKVEACPGGGEGGGGGVAPTTELTNPGR